MQLLNFFIMPATRPPPETTKNYITYDNSTKQYTIEFRVSFEHHPNVNNVNFESLKKLMLKEQFGVEHTRFTTPIETFEKVKLTEIVAKLSSEYDKFLNVLKIADQWPVLPLTATTSGKLVVGSKIPSGMSLHLSGQLQKTLGITLPLTVGEFKGSLNNSLIAMSIHAPGLIASTTNLYHEIATIPVTNKNWFCPKIPYYLPLAINDLTGFDVIVKDFDGDAIDFNDSQVILVLHFK
jgi:hypothetical protein